MSTLSGYSVSTAGRAGRHSSRAGAEPAARVPKVQAKVRNVLIKLLKGRRSLLMLLLSANSAATTGKPPKAVGMKGDRSKFSSKLVRPVMPVRTSYSPEGSQGTAKRSGGEETAGNSRGFDELLAKLRVSRSCRIAGIAIRHRHRVVLLSITQSSL
jgi:hypothetical protein